MYWPERCRGNARLLLSALLLFLAWAPGWAQEDLPEVSDASGPALCKQVRTLLPILRKHRGPLSEESLRKLETLLDRQPTGAERTAAAVQKLLDAHCLVGVSINPESRVKAVRGPAPARLRQGREVPILVRVHNEAGVTPALTVRSPQQVKAGKTGEGRWLEVRIEGSGRTSGGTLDYCLLMLRAQECGKREATLQFDVGQGTQDLGFRAETSILFIIEPGEQRGGR